jgi:hypothetical protein
MTSLQANPVFLQSDNYVLHRKRTGRGREREIEDRRKKEKRGLKKKLKVYDVIIQKCFKPV